MLRATAPASKSPAASRPNYAQILTPDAVAFAARLQRAFGAAPRRTARARAPRARREFDAGKLPDFLRRDARRPRRRLDVRAVPADIAGPPRRDHRPGRPQDDHQRAQLGRQRVHGRLRGRQHADAGTTTSRASSTCATRSAGGSTSRRPKARPTSSNDKTATLFVRPRGWHLPEKHVLDRRRADLAAASSTSRCTSSTTRRSCVARGSGPYFYLPKLESHLEARLWNDIFVMAQDELGIPRGTIKATVLIETILAAFEMDEILYELREHSAGLNCRPLGLHLQLHQEIPQQPRLLPRRSRAGHDDDALHEELRRAAGQDLPSPQHPRDGRHGGADSGQERRSGQRRGVRQGEGRQGARGDATATTARGSRIPGLVPVAKEAFDRLMPAPNQIATQEARRRAT